MKPVLAAFKDQELFLKHNLNAGVRELERDGPADPKRCGEPDPGYGAVDRGGEQVHRA